MSWWEMMIEIVAGIFALSVPIIWIWVLFHKIKCRKVQSCSNRRCRFWAWCRHNCVERKKDELRMRIERIKKIMEYEKKIKNK